MPGTQSGPISGKWASISGVGSLARWSIVRNVPMELIKNSATGGGTDRNDQTRDWNGTYEALGGFPDMLPGQVVAFSGYVGPRSGVKGTVGDLWSGSVLCTQAAITWDWENNNVLSHSVNFNGNGVLTKNEAGAEITDGTALVNESPKVLKLTHGTSTEITHRKKAVLTLSIDSTPVKNSSTDCETQYQGGNLDWTLAVDVDDVGQFLDEGAFLETIKLFTKTTSGVGVEPWVLNYGKVGATSGLEVKPGSTDVVKQTVNIGMKSNHETTGALGYVLKPDGTALWGTAPA